MRFELPDCKRCCLCVPLRHGILIFGYLNLVFSILILSLEIWLELKHPSTPHNMFIFRGVGMYTHIWFPYLIYSLEVVFNVILLVGAHRKDTLILRAYYYYGIMTTIAVFLTFIVVRRFNEWRDWYYPDQLDICLAISGIGLQCYLLLLIRTELNKLSFRRQQFRFVNNMAEVIVDPLKPGDDGNPL